MTTTDRDPIHAPCPKCHARPGQPCRSESGQTYGPGHRWRFHAARKGGRARQYTRETASMQRQAGRVGGLTSWANTVDRTERTSPGRRAGPGAIEYWLARLGPEFADATDQQRVAAAQAAKLGYYHELARRSAVTRSAKAARRTVATS